MQSLLPRHFDPGNDGHHARRRNDIARLEPGPVAEGSQANEKESQIRCSVLVLPEGLDRVGDKSSGSNQEAECGEHL